RECERRAVGDSAEVAAALLPARGGDGRQSAVGDRLAVAGDRVAEEERRAVSFSESRRRGGTEDSVGERGANLSLRDSRTGGRPRPPSRAPARLRRVRGPGRPPGPSNLRNDLPQRLPAPNLR